MKLLLDTNILLDCMMDRQPFAADARKLLILGALGEVDLWMSPSQFTDAFYLLTEGGKPRLAESVKLRLLKVKRLARICTLGEYDIENALESSWPDFEDACLYQCAKKLHAEAIIKPISIARPSPSTTAPSSSPISRTSTASCTRRLTGRMLWLAVQTLRCTFWHLHIADFYTSSILRPAFL